MDNEKVFKQQPSQHRTDSYASKIDRKVDALQRKRVQLGLKKTESTKPKGGFDETPIPQAPVGYTLKITFHRARNLPFADLNTLSSDPFVLAQLNTQILTRHKQDPPLRFRTPTIQRSVDPVWNAEWVVANVPATGFKLKARIYDEDPADHDDRLGNVHVDVDGISDTWSGIEEQTFAIKKRMGSKRAYLFRSCAALFNRNIRMSGELIVSVESLGRTESDAGGRVWTIGPCNWTRHFSPMIGMIAGTKDPGENKGDGKKQTERYDFQANQIQLAGPVPAELYHRYVEFKPFIAGAFESSSLRGWLINRALHHQHSRIYNYDKNTVYGSFPAPCREMTLKFLDLVHFDKGGRIFTYVITLDGKWRFTETGKEFGIDMLSKHSMHSDVNIYIAFSGEFFIRRHQRPHSKHSNSYASGKVSIDAEATHPPDPIDNGPPDSEPPHDPAYYSLVIDNDSGTYRPNAKILPQLKKFMQKQLPGLHVTTLDCNGDKEKMDKWKNEQRQRKKKEGKTVIVRQQSSMSDDGSSISSSDEEDLQERAKEYNDDGGDNKASGAAAAKEHGLKEKVEEKLEIAKEKVNEKLKGDKTGTVDEKEKATGGEGETETGESKLKNRTTTITHSESVGTGPTTTKETTTAEMNGAAGLSGPLAQGVPSDVGHVKL